MTGVQTCALPIYLAEIARMELAVIDEGTTTRDFARTLRLNQVYHRLAQGA